MLSSSPAMRADRHKRSARWFHADDGFGIMEAVVALAIIFGMILILMRTLDSSGRVLVESRRQSAANALALELVERAQALEWANMGLAVSTNGAACPAQVGCYASEFPTLTATTDGWAWGSPAEEIVFATGETFRPFLDFQEQLDRDGTVFTRYIFITSVDDDGDGNEDFRRLTAVVRWVPPDGFRRQVIQTTLVAPFTEPSQPLIRSDVSWSGGSIDLQPRTNDLFFEGDPSDSGDDVTVSATNIVGAVVFGSDPLRLSVTMPQLEVTGITDYVSSAAVRTESMSIASLVRAGVDGVFGTGDDPATVSFDPAAYSATADDDNLTSDPTSVGPAVWLGSAVVYRSVDTSLVVADIGSGETIDSIDGSETNTVGGSAEVDVLHDDNVALNPDEDLPYGLGGYTGPDKTLIGLVGSGSRFGFYERVGTLEVSAEVDRDNQVNGDRDVFGGVQLLATNTIRLLDDAVLADDDGDFEGWVVIDPPSGLNSGVKAPLRVSSVGAGETGAFTTLVSGTKPVLTVYVWNVDSGDYDVVGTVDFTDTPPGCDDPVASTTGAVQQDEVTFGGVAYDSLRYTVAVELDVRGFCETTTTDADSNVSLHVWQTGGPMVSGEIDYVVEGNLAGTYTTLIDFTMVVATDQIIITSAFIDPGVE